MATRTATETERQRTAGEKIIIGGAPFIVPTDALGEYELIADVPLAAYLDTANVIYCDVFQLQGAEWQHVCGNRPSGWRGGAFTDEDGRANAPPVLSTIDAAQFRGQTIKVEFEVVRAMRCGGRVELEPMRSR